MTRRRRRSRDERPGPPAFLVVDKPEGRTSHDVVDAARRWLGTRRVGHLGTLDPQATGVLPLAVRGATKLVPFLDGSTKAYTGTVRLGQETDTLDADGQVVREHEGTLPGRDEVERALEAFVGDIEQIPPMYSAVKHQGERLHRLARRGEEVERAPKKVRIERLELSDFTGPDVELAVECSAGTYVRTLAADLGAKLGCGAHLLRLRRTRSGGFREAAAHSFEVLEEAAAEGRIEELLIPAAGVLGYPEVTLRSEALARVRHGGDVGSSAAGRLRPGTRVAGVDEAGQLVAVLELGADRRLRPLRVLQSEADEAPQ
ncbi:MAG: tRNA pseudouridine(55) synthase TruB [Proteobacteria bacterium]|nr:tRNA pseudouridine(55) synthase TruB [Pseudomonadota bacterium]